MSTIETLRLSVDRLGTVDALWQQVIGHVQHFLRDRRLPAQEVVVLLPFVQHVAQARQAWASAFPTAWAPRFETTQTLARALAPTRPTPPGALSFDIAADTLQAAGLLRSQEHGGGLQERRQFERIVTQLVQTAQAMARVRMALAPERREAWLAGARALLVPVGGPGGVGSLERALARVALEWSETADCGPADALFAHRPAAWIALQAGAIDPLVQSLMSTARVPALCLDADVPVDRWPGLLDHAPAMADCADFEDEAQHAAAQVLGHLQRAERPVALIALDRVLLRRVRALLERQQVALADETGWRLSTTRAGAHVVGLLRAVLPTASTDDVLDWLASSLPALPGRLALDAHWRREQVSAVLQVDAASMPDEAASAWQAWLAIAQPLATLQEPRRASLAQWLLALQAALRAADLWLELAQDAAGSRVLAALHADDPATRGSAWGDLLNDTRFDAAGFAAWAESVLETEPFQPAGDGLADVVITPMARAVLRPFAAVVCPGADAQRLGAVPAPHPLLGDALARKLGLPVTPQPLEDEQRAFAQLLRVPRLSLSRRCSDDGEPLQPSPLLLQLQWACEQFGHAPAPMTEARIERRVPVDPQVPPQPVAPALLPSRISATVYEALRACPYRFFAQHVLRLGEDEELDDAIDKRDYGNWLHEVLLDFHRQRDASRPQDDETLLRRIASTGAAALGQGAAAFLPFVASFEGVIPHYVAWLHGAEAEGFQLAHAELPIVVRPDVLGDAAPGLRGQLDRVDIARLPGQTVARIVDYKTTAVSGLRARLSDPGEDTQLAFYAAMLASARDSEFDAIEAGYLPLDGREPVKLLIHPQVLDSARALLAGIATDFARLHAGAAMPALGEGSVCEHCRARGLCRRDHWAAPGAAVPDMDADAA